jgi:cytochrome P450
MRMSETEITLPNGHKIPPHSQFAFAMKSMSSDDTIWDSPDTFDGFRFERLAQAAKNTADQHSWQFVASK